MFPSSTIVARLSPPGKSAIACLGIAGPAAWEIVRDHFRRPRNRPLPESPTVRSLFFGSFGDISAGDQVILFVRQAAPNWFLEIDCHGGPQVVRMIEDVLAARNASILSADRWRQEIHGGERADMLDVLERCPTTRTASIALNQWNGAFDRAVSEVESSIAAGRDGDAAARIARLTALLAVGEHLVRPWKVAIAGAPNVGKSSLVNALAGFTRSVVNPTPGTTRDVVSTALAFDGWPIELLDTAGLRETADELEAEGIARAEAARRSADLVIHVLDATAPPERPTAFDELVVVNKIDRQATWDVAPVPLQLSARTGFGVDRLIESIVAKLVPTAPGPGEATPIVAAHRDRLGRLEAALAS